MICYRDRSYCVAECATKDCQHRLTDQVVADAEAWRGKPGAPIAIMDFTEECEDYSKLNHKGE